MEKKRESMAENAEMPTFEEYQSELVQDQIIESLRVIALLKSKFKCNRPLFALLMIKRKIKAGRSRDITVANVQKWGR